MAELPQESVQEVTTKVQAVAFTSGRGRGPWWEGAVRGLHGMGVLVPRDGYGAFAL